MSSHHEPAPATLRPRGPPRRDVHQRQADPHRRHRVDPARSLCHRATPARGRAADQSADGRRHGRHAGRIPDRDRKSRHSADGASALGDSRCRIPVFHVQPRHRARHRALQGRHRNRGRPHPPQPKTRGKCRHHSPGRQRAADQIPHDRRRAHPRAHAPQRHAGSTHAAPTRRPDGRGRQIGRSNR